MILAEYSTLLSALDIYTHVKILKVESIRPATHLPRNFQQPYSGQQENSRSQEKDRQSEFLKACVANIGAFHLGEGS